MANTVLFKKGPASSLPASASRDANTLYYTTDTGEFYLGSTRFSDVILDTAEPALSSVLANQIHVYNNKLYFRGTKDESGSTVAALITVDPGKTAGDIKALQDLVGSIPSSATSTNVVDYIAEYAVKTVAAAASDASVLVDNTDEKNPKLSVNLHTAANDEAANALVKKNDGLYVPTPASADTYKLESTTASGSNLATYVLNRYANGNESGTPTSVGTINIPKDFLLKSGTVEEVTESNKSTDGRPATPGTYLKLVLNTADSTDGTETNKVLWVDVGKLIEYVTSGSESGDMIFVTVDATTHKVTATITDNTVTNAKLADKTIENGKIKDATIEKGKLVSAVQTSLTAADTAVQGADIKANAGTTDDDKGTFTVTVRSIASGVVSTEDKKVKVNGLGSAAYVDTVASVAASGSTTGKVPTDAAVRTELDLKATKVVAGLNETLTDVVPTLTSDGDLKSSGYKLGADELAETPSDKTLATEKAVSEAVQAAVSSGLSWGSF